MSMDKDLKDLLLKLAWIFTLIVVLTVHLNLWIKGGQEVYVYVASVINFLLEGGVLGFTAKKVFKTKLEEEEKKNSNPEPNIEV